MSANIIGPGRTSVDKTKFLTPCPDGTRILSEGDRQWTINTPTIQHVRMWSLWGQGVEDEQNEGTWDCWRWRRGGSLNVVVGFALFKRQHLNKTWKKWESQKILLGKYTLGRGACQCKDPQMSVCLACSRNSIEAGAVWARERAREHEVRQVTDKCPYRPVGRLWLLHWEKWGFPGCSEQSNGMVCSKFKGSFWLLCW